MPPYSVPFFPSGKGEIKDIAVEISNEDVLLTTMQKQNDGIIFRLFNAQNTENTANVSVLGTNAKISLAPFEYKTYVLKNDKLSEMMK